MTDDNDLPRYDRPMRWGPKIDLRYPKTGKTETFIQRDDLVVTAYFGPPLSEEQAKRMDENMKKYFGLS